MAAEATLAHKQGGVVTYAAPLWLVALVALKEDVRTVGALLSDVIGA